MGINEGHVAKGPLAKGPLAKGPLAKGPLAQPPPQLLNWLGLLTGPGSRRRILLTEGVY